MEEEGSKFVDEHTKTICVNSKCLRAQDGQRCLEGRELGLLRLIHHFSSEEKVKRGTAGELKSQKYN